MAIGFIDTMDAAGWLIMIKEFANKNNGLGFSMLISAILWTLNCLATMYLMRIAQYNYGIYLARKHGNYAEGQ